jgi:hypothetical protein
LTNNKSCDIISLTTKQRRKQMRLYAGLHYVKVAGKWELVIEFNGNKAITKDVVVNFGGVEC